MKTMRFLKYAGFGILGLAFVTPGRICYHEPLELAYTNVVPWSGINLLANSRTIPVVEDTAYGFCAVRPSQEP